MASTTRIFNELSAVVTGTKVKIWVTGDYGIQTSPAGGSHQWYGGAAIARIQVAPRVWAAARLERYSDPDQVIVATGTANGFRVSGGSLNVDVAPVSGVLWRVELRGLKSLDAIYPHHLSGLANTDGFIVTSIALTI